MTDPNGNDLPRARILMVCTGNVCRSPMAHALLAGRVEAEGIAAVVSSAGLVTEGRAASAPAVELLAARGLDLTGHRSRKLAAVDLAGQDLIVGMERRHVREVTLADREVFARTFTLPDLARRSQLHGPRRPGESIAGWLERISLGREPAALAAPDPADEVPDPYRRSPGTYRRVAEMLDGLLDVTVANLFPPGLR